jgi:hypothetical protein
LTLTNNYKCTHKSTGVSGGYTQPAERNSAGCGGTVIDEVSSIFILFVEHIHATWKYFQVCLLLYVSTKVTSGDRDLQGAQPSRRLSKAEEIKTLISHLMQQHHHKISFSYWLS